MLSSFSDNLSECYAYTVILVCRFAKDFVKPFQRASFICYFTLGFFPDYNFNFYVSPIQITYISGRSLSFIFMFLCSKWYLEKKFVISHLELEFYVEDTVDWGKKLLVNFNAEKTQLDSFDWSNNIDAIDKKMDGPVPVVEIIFCDPGVVYLL